MPAPFARSTREVSDLPTVLTVDPATAAHRRCYPSVSLLVPLEGPTALAGPASPPPP